MDPRYVALVPDAKLTFKGGFVPAIHAAASMMEAGQGGEKKEAKAAQ